MAYRRPAPEPGCAKGLGRLSPSEDASRSRALTFAPELKPLEDNTDATARLDAERAAVSAQVREADRTAGPPAR